MVAEKVPHCLAQDRANLMAQAVSIACLRIARPGPGFVCLDLILEMLAAELWTNASKSAAAASRPSVARVRYAGDCEAVS